jgi:ribosomal protein S18 acetylase RimI-like enzyme
MIRSIQTSDIPQVVDLWNRMHDNNDWILSPVATKDIQSICFQTQASTFVYWKQNTIIGLVSGIVSTESNRGYITMILVEPNHQRQGIGTLLINHLEHHMTSGSPTIQSIDIVFHNPISLRWNIQHLPGVEHPMMPGVLEHSSGHAFFNHHNYHLFAQQEVYYRDITDYRVSNNIIQKKIQLERNNILVEHYNKTVHTGFDQLFESLQSSSWKTEVEKGIQFGYPVLIVSCQKKIIGFAGPLFIENSKRGYFAGIGVHKDYRKQGIASVLFASLCAELSQMGATYMTLFTGTTNPAKQIYLQEGFHVVQSFVNLRKQLHNITK